MGLNPWSLRLLVCASEQVELPSELQHQRPIREVAFAESRTLRDFNPAGHLRAGCLGELGEVPRDADRRTDEQVDLVASRNQEVEAQVDAVGEGLGRVRLLAEHPLLGVLRQDGRRIFVDHQTDAPPEVHLEEGDRHDVEAHHGGERPAVAVDVGVEAVGGNIRGSCHRLLSPLAIELHADRELDHGGSPGLEVEVQARADAPTILLSVSRVDRVEVVEVGEVEGEGALLVAALAVFLDLVRLGFGLISLVLYGLEIRFGGGALAGDDGDTDRIRTTSQGDELRGGAKRAGLDRPDAPEGGLVGLGGRIVGGQLADRSSGTARRRGVGHLRTDVVDALVGVPGHRVGALQLELCSGAFLHGHLDLAAAGLGDLDVGRGSAGAVGREGARAHAVRLLELPLPSRRGLRLSRAGHDEDDEEAEEQVDVFHALFS